MKKNAALLLPLLVVIAAATAWPGTPGSFRGKVVRPPAGKEHQGWLYVQGRNKMLRRVAVETAVVVYSNDVPGHQREKDPAKGLFEGTEVRVTAEQDDAGEWRALRIEILKVPARASSAKARAA